ncbi:MAG: hypothetical protein WCI87_09725 [Euryarchaeota archaeon]
MLHTDFVLFWQNVNNRFLLINCCPELPHGGRCRQTEKRRELGDEVRDEVKTGMDVLEYRCKRETPT